MKERIIWLDNLKGTLIFLVVLGHCIQFSSPNPDKDVLFNFIYSFHMPLFMCLSGFACYKQNLKWNIVYRRFIQLIIPFFSFNAINAFLTGHNYLSYFYNPQIGLWFLWVLFFITILQISVSKLSIRCRFGEEFMTLLIFITLFGIGKATHLSIFAVDMIVSFWLYYAIGYFLRKHEKVLLELKKTYIGAVLLICFFIVSLTYNRSVVPGFISFVPHLVYVRLVPIIGILTIMFFGCKYCNKNISLLNAMGGGTLGVYAIHLQFFVKPEVFNLNIDTIFLYYLYNVVLATALTAISYALTIVLSKSKYSSLLLLGKT